MSFLKKEDGPTAVEYAVMLALIIAVCTAAITETKTTTPSDVKDISIYHRAIRHHSPRRIPR